MAYSIRLSIPIGEAKNSYYQNFLPYLENLQKLCRLLKNGQFPEAERLVNETSTVDTHPLSAITNKQLIYSKTYGMKLVQNKGVSSFNEESFLQYNIKNVIDSIKKYFDEKKQSECLVSNMSSSGIREESCVETFRNLNAYST